MAHSSKGLRGFYTGKGQAAAIRAAVINLDLQSIATAYGELCRKNGFAESTRSLSSFTEGYKRGLEINRTAKGLREAPKQTIRERTQARIERRHKVVEKQRLEKLRKISKGGEMFKPLQARANDDDHAAWKEAAIRRRMHLADWVRMALNNQIKADRALRYGANEDRPVEAYSTDDALTARRDPQGE